MWRAMNFYTVRDLAERLQVTDRTIREYLHTGRLTGFKVGREWRFTDEDLQRFVESQRQASYPEEATS